MNDDDIFETMIAEETTNISFQSDIHYSKSLNKEQQNAYDIILDCVLNNKNEMFFIDGSGGTEKTYLYKTLFFDVRSRNLIALATISSGVAASQLPAALPRLIIWDETPMVHKYAFETLDKMLRDITKYQLPFGGKVIVCEGDFRQLALIENMKAKLDPSFCEYLLKIGNGIEKTHSCQMITLPEDITINFEDEFK
ncbi:ATP-dependent DNA helicase PIF2-like [Olea europaea var. sylvestris]|uniref:ATP-dependent DNA helicase PIF2-like n=1 Tax=Olea europaea var. sylvestris TaxID=158386 RepID=UPI000C1D5E7F|nr:ATP-dependent DNA helicase PIF2-like [Olea europaea var. sylvestris]